VSRQRSPLRSMWRGCPSGVDHERRVASHRAVRPAHSLPGHTSVTAMPDRGARWPERRLGANGRRTNASSSACSSRRARRIEAPAACLAALSRRRSPSQCRCPCSGIGYLAHGSTLRSRVPARHRVPVLHDQTDAATRPQARRARDLH
jgi:hypothetical protein